MSLSDRLKANNPISICDGIKGDLEILLDFNKPKELRKAMFIDLYNSTLRLYADNTVMGIPDAKALAEDMKERCETVVKNYKISTLFYNPRSEFEEISRDVNSIKIYVGKKQYGDDSDWVHNPHYRV
jgi:hypothetical protein